MPKGYIVITEDVKDPAGMAEYASWPARRWRRDDLSFDPKPRCSRASGTAPRPSAGVRVGRGGPRVVQLRRVPGGGQAPPGRRRLQRRHRPVADAWREDQRAGRLRSSRDQKLGQLPRAAEERRMRRVDGQLLDAELRHVSASQRGIDDPVASDEAAGQVGRPEVRHRHRCDRGVAEPFRGRAGRTPSAPSPRRSRGRSTSTRRRSRRTTWRRRRRTSSSSTSLRRRSNSPSSIAHRHRLGVGAAFPWQRAAMVRDGVNASAARTRHSSRSRWPAAGTAGRLR